MNTIHPTPKSVKFLENSHPVLLPDLAQSPFVQGSKPTSSVHRAPTAKRSGRGCRARPTIVAMMSSPDQWFKIKGSEDYQFPGVFSAPYPQRLGYCPDITKLGLYTPESPDFLYYDIQFGKDKPRNPQRMTVTLPDTEEALNVIYRLYSTSFILLILYISHSTIETSDRTPLRTALRRRFC